MQLRKRGDVWYGTWQEGGRRIVRTTRCTDRKAAEARVRQWERDAADPNHAFAQTATLTAALKLLLRNEETP